MKTTRTKGNFKTFFKRNLGVIMLVLCLLAVGTTVTLAVLLKDGNTSIEPPDDGQVVVPPVTYALPVDNYVLGEQASLDSPIWLSSLKKWATHNGIDFIADIGTPVKAIANGTVKSVVVNPLEGTVIVIEHANGLESIYKSLGEETEVGAGDTVAKGQVIGYVSDTAIFESHVGAHLHFEMKQDGQIVDPALFLDIADK